MTGFLHITVEENGNGRDKRQQKKNDRQER